MRKRTIRLVFVLGLIAPVVGLLLNCDGSSSSSPCAKYCKQMRECEGGDYYDYDYYGGNSFSVLEHIQCVENCNDISDDDNDLYDCLIDCGAENDCDDWSQCYWDCVWEPYYYYG